jgi:hypothetical protein
VKRIVFLIPVLICLFLQSVGSVNGVWGTFGEMSGTDGLIVQEDLKVFPNPVLDKKFTVELYKYAISEIKISNIAGKQVYERKFTLPVNRYEVLTNDLPNGIYLLRISASNNTFRTIKLLINSPR